MAKRIEFTEEQKEEIRMKYCKRRKLKDSKSYNRIEILNMRRLGKKNEEISEKTGFHVQYVTEVVSLYVNKGMDAVIALRKD